MFPASSYRRVVGEWGVGAHWGDLGEREGVDEPEGGGGHLVHPSDLAILL